MSVDKISDFLLTDVYASSAIKRALENGGSQLDQKAQAELISCQANIACFSAMVRAFILAGQQIDSNEYKSIVEKLGNI